MAGLNLRETPGRTSAQSWAIVLFGAFLTVLSPRCHAQSAAHANAAAALTNADVRAQQLRSACIQGRRMICGKILKVQPDGLVVESGYSSLVRPELDRSWLIPGTVQAAPDPHLVENKVPGDIASGIVFLVDLPRPRGPKPKPKPYDYVVIEAYPAGQYTYTSVGTIQRTVRRFSCGLETAVRLNLSAETGERTNAAPASGVR